MSKQPSRVGIIRKRKTPILGRQIRTVHSQDSIDAKIDGFVDSTPLALFTAKHEVIDPDPAYKRARRIGIAVGVAADALGAAGIYTVAQYFL